MRCNNLPLIFCFSGEFQVTSRPTNSIDYFETDLDDDDGSGSGFSNDNSSLARIVKIATAILGVLLIIVLCAILCKHDVPVIYYFGIKSSISIN